MDIVALSLSRLQFAFTASVHVVFLSFTIGLAAWLSVIETLCLVTGTMVATIFALASSAVAISFWLFMITFSVAISDAGAQHCVLLGESLFVFPPKFIRLSASASSEARSKHLDTTDGRRNQ